MNNCDVFLSDGEQTLLGMSFDREFDSAPVLTFKSQGRTAYYSLRLIKKLGIPCFEKKSLTKKLSDLKKGETIPETYYRDLAIVYSKLDKFKEEDNSKLSEMKISEDINNQLYLLEKDVNTAVFKDYSKKHKQDQDQPAEKMHSSYPDFLESFKKKVASLSKEYGFKYRYYHNKKNDNDIDEFCLTLTLKDYNINFYYLVFLSQQEQKIYIETRDFFKAFDMDQSNYSLGLIEEMLEGYSKKIKKDAEVYCKEFESNPKISDIVHNSIKSILEKNYQEMKLEYGYYHNNIINTIVLRKKDDSSRMFEISITNKAFMSDVKFFEEFISAPKLRKVWNFWCKEKKYNPEVFDLHCE